MTIYRGPGGAGDATNDAIVNAVAAYATSAASSADNAANSASAASTSAANASTAATNAASSASQAATSASNSASSASTASTQASTATTQASNAAASATAASSSAASASTYASNAASSASTATSKAAEAETYAIRAETAETNAETAYASTLGIFGDAADVANAVAAASTSATNAANSATTAASSATAASGSATTAGNYASAALNSANTANAEASEAQSAANTAVAALQSAQAIYGGLDDVTAAVNEAEDWATQSANSATASSASSSAAQTSANSAATSATNAANSATQSAASAASAAAIVTGVASNRASIRPSLLLDFANTKQLDPRITYSRASTGTYYDGKTVVKAEENLLTYSQDFSNTAWSAAATGITRTANATTAPDGTNTASAVTGDGATSVHYFGQNFVYSSTATYAFSVYVKANGVNYIQLILGGGTGYANFNVTSGAGAVGTYSAAFSNLAIQDVGNGWYRCSCLIVNNSNANIYICLSDAANKVRADVSFATSGGVYLWGAQLEQRSTLTAYTPTTTAPITNYIPALQTAAAGVPRFDHDPITGESKGFLIEEQRTNLLTYSSDLSNTIWFKQAAGSGSAPIITSNIGIAPDGTQTACEAYFTLNGGTTTADQSFLMHLVSVVAGTPYTYSFWAKTTDGSSVVLSFRDDLLLPINSNVTVTPTWTRYSFTGTTGVTGGSRFKFWLRGNIGTSNSARVLIWGCQAEAGSFATSYIPTVASQVTRSADSASMTGANFSSWFNQVEGTMYIDTASPVINGYSGWAVSNGTTASFMRVRPADNYIQTSGVTQLSQTTVSQPNTFYKSALAYKYNDSNSAVNGVAATSDNSVVVPTVNYMGIVNIDGSSNVSTGYIKRIAYYPKRLSNQELQGLTS